MGEQFAGGQNFPAQESLLRLIILFRTHPPSFPFFLSRIVAITTRLFKRVRGWSGTFDVGITQCYEQKAFIAALKTYGNIYSRDCNIGLSNLVDPGNWTALRGMFFMSRKFEQKS